MYRSPTPIVTRHILVLTVFVLTAGELSGCGTINEKLSSGMADVIPVWAGGLPSDVPPRQGTPEYDQFMKERERQRAMPAAERGSNAKPASTAQDAIH